MVHSSDFQTYDVPIALLTMASHPQVDALVSDLSSLTDEDLASKHTLELHNFRFRRLSVTGPRLSCFFIGALVSGAGMPLALERATGADGNSLNVL